MDPSASPVSPALFKLCLDLHPPPSIGPKAQRRKTSRAPSRLVMLSCQFVSEEHPSPWLQHVFRQAWIYPSLIMKSLGLLAWWKQFTVQ